ncbi:hypothetical protein A8C56_11425 [Niabella ginsenosidivorans]|uniref:Uncharacterized protein n=1 Tax=Niabella ginsenosidivorans TaxID=1176587 RepID=A0A1A9I1K4_9BACT|nr:hypothetical protein [Niabella ginsenosidivorans]ANH81506.1 hypothetical protein A8C56_11425 [Niabella ginsenosidivorans]
MSRLIEDKIKQIQEKLVQLCRKNAAIEKENSALKQALEESKASAAAAASNMEAMQQQLDIARYGNTQMSPEERKAFEKRINSYLREIDKCIALLSV